MAQGLSPTHNSLLNLFMGRGIFAPHLREFHTFLKLRTQKCGELVWNFSSSRTCPTHYMYAFCPTQYMQFLQNHHNSTCTRLQFLQNHHNSTSCTQVHFLQNMPHSLHVYNSSSRTCPTHYMYTTVPPEHAPLTTCTQLHTTVPPEHASLTTCIQQFLQNIPHSLHVHNSSSRTCHSLHTQQFLQTMPHSLHVHNSSPPLTTCTQHFLQNMSHSLHVHNTSSRTCPTHYMYTTTVPPEHAPLTTCTQLQFLQNMPHSLHVHNSSSRTCPTHYMYTTVPTEHDSLHVHNSSYRAIEYTGKG